MRGARLAVIGGRVVLMVSACRVADVRGVCLWFLMLAGAFSVLCRADPDAVPGLRLSWRGRCGDVWARLGVIGGGSGVHRWRVVLMVSACRAADA